MVGTFDVEAMGLAATVGAPADGPYRIVGSAMTELEPLPIHRLGGDEPTRKWLLRCREIAEGPLDGIEGASADLADFAHGDRRMMERARRFLLAVKAERPGDRTVAQMLSLWRRSFEKGQWDWDD